MLVLQGPWIFLESPISWSMHNLFSCITNLDKLTNFLLRVITNNNNQYISIPIIITWENLWRKQNYLICWQIIHLVVHLPDLWQAFYTVSKISPFSRGTLGGGGGYPTPQYRKKNCEIPKYRVQNRRITDTAFMIGHVLLQSIAISLVCHL